ncbi:hypothetical protein GCM10025867_04940 [Frondihabitans sucicola]|uniref:Asp23/Gls24 family envelope stress response protein n=1 Tax=Frondihabitans sucicola TaxID=1268041 RepID=A0ABM8GIP9_9MICO|nr:hypothetical protein [Frondihabitans sucicola]BDZ48253.1 hypothetical protein GCM10025867_04940 [Frondihabitans sucicola]
MSDLEAVRLRALADELEALVTEVPGVLRVQPRLGVARFAKRVVEGLVAARQGAGSQGLLPRIGVTVTADATLVSLDVAVARDHSGPVVVRAVAAAILQRLAGEALPPAKVDVRIVSVG